MSDSEGRKPDKTDSEAEAEAQRAADGLKDQIAAVRARIRDARETLREHAERQQAPRGSKCSPIR
ncbi:hypothetical protein [Phenylobacterium sp.]|uniref:hypothetical protein n=1 Tax=Phenylobacterium sp. TaxID=1871053 RepID=UPI00391DE762